MTIPKRPSRYDDAVKRWAADIAFDALLKEFPDDFDEDQRADCVDEISGALGGDAYEVVRALDRRGWVCDRSMIDFFDRDFVSDAIDRFEADWVKAYGVRSEHLRGCVVDIRIRGQQKRGVVIDVRAGEAKLTVQTPDDGFTERGGWVVNAEDAVVVAAEVARESA